MPTITQLPALAQADIVPGSDSIPIVNGGATKKVTPQALVNKTASAITPQGGTMAVTGEITKNTLPVGYLAIPPNSQSADYTAVAADAGKSIDHPATDANARTFTIPANASVPFEVGTCLTFTNMTAQVVTIAITSDTMYLSGTGATGSRSLAQYGIATARKLTSTTWLISGQGLT